MRPVGFCKSLWRKSQTMTLPCHTSALAPDKSTNPQVLPSFSEASFYSWALGSKARCPVKAANSCQRPKVVAQENTWFLSCPLLSTTINMCHIYSTLASGESLSVGVCDLPFSVYENTLDSYSYWLKTLFTYTIVFQTLIICVIKTSWPPAVDYLCSSLYFLLPTWTVLGCVCLFICSFVLYILRLKVKNHV